MAAVTLDESRWPLIEIRYPDAFGSDDWAVLIEGLVGILKRDQPFAVINDVRSGAAPNALQRKQVADMYKAHPDLVKRNWLGTAFVTDSPIARGALTAVTWLIPQPHPVKVFSKYAEGEAWAQEQLRARL